MSQTKLKRGNFHITAGFDRSDDHFFANIDEQDSDDPWYSTIFDPHADGRGGYPTLHQLRLKVESLIGVLPEEFWNNVDIRDMNKIRIVDDFEDGESRLPAKLRAN